ncbi:MAG: hypothetical protein QM820_07670 [Minicystis sp.]
MSSKSKVRIGVGDDKKSVDTRIDRGVIVADVAPNNPAVQSSPALKTSAAALVQAGADLKAREERVTVLRNQLEVAGRDLEAQIAVYDAAYDSWAAHVENTAGSPEEAAALGMSVLEKNEYTLAAPLGITAHYDAAKGLLRIHVRRAPGMRACRIEVSVEPIGPTTWQELPGNGARAAVSGLAPGLYWVRAASVVAGARSTFTGPVSVMIK